MHVTVYLMQVMVRLISLLLVAFLSVSHGTENGDAEQKHILVDDFEAYENGSIPAGWKILRGRNLVSVSADHMNENEWFSVTRENGNKALRVYSHREVATLTMPTERGDPNEWEFSKNPILSWDWRALRLPEGANEKEEKLNDSGIAIYVIFAVRGLLIKRPVSIKYTYSTTLPVGTVVSYGRLKVVVVSSGLDGLNDWHHIERNVVEDYRTLFGDEPPEIPVGIRLWSDTDNTNGYAEAEYDNIVFK